MIRTQAAHKGPSVDDRAYRRKNRKIVAQLSCFLCCLLLAFDHAFAAPMTFKNVSTGGNHCCWWTAAEGEITDETPGNFEQYLNSEKYPGTPIRLKLGVHNWTLGFGNLGFRKERWVFDQTP